MAYYKMNSFVAKVKFFRDRSKYSEPAKQGMIKLFYTNKDASDDTKIIKERTEEFDRSKLFKSDVSTYGVCSVLAGEHLQLGNMKEAEKMAQNAIEAAAHTKQQDNIYEAYAEGILGEVLYAQSNYKESAEHFHKALKAYEHHTRSSTGPESLMLVAATQLISWLSLSKNDTLNSQSYCRTALSMTERLLGPDHPDTGNCMFNLATANMKAGDISKGTEGLLNRSLQIYQSDSIKANDISLHKDSRRNALHLLSLMYTERYTYTNTKIKLNFNYNVYLFIIFYLEKILVKQLNR